MAIGVIPVLYIGNQIPEFLNNLLMDTYEAVGGCVDSEESDSEPHAHNHVPLSYSIYCAALTSYLISIL